MKTIIISAFPGMGKSYTANHLSQYKMFDLESSNYSWIEIDNKKIRNPVFPQNYIKTIKNLIFQNLYQIIFISSHKIVRQQLQKNKIQYYFIYPDIFLKDEYIERFKQRGNDQQFIKLLEQNWESWITQIQKEQHNKYCCKIKILQKNFYLSNFLNVKKI